MLKCNTDALLRVVLVNTISVRLTCCVNWAIVWSYYYQRVILNSNPYS